MDLWFCGNTTNGSTTLKDSWFPLRWPQEEDGCRVDAINIVIALCTGCVALVTNIFHRTISRRWRVSRIHWGLSTLREMLWLLLLLVHLVEMGDALLGRWMLHALLIPIASLLAWVLWLPLHRVSYSWILRLLGIAAFFSSAAFRFLRVVQLVNLPLDWSHMRLHASAWAGSLLLAMATIELYSTCRTVCDKDLKWEGPKNANEAETVQSYKYASANLYSKATFFWLTPLLWVGYTSPLELQDLGQLPKEEKTEHQFKKFNDIYTSEQLAAGRKGRKVSLWWCYFRSCWKMFALGGLLKLMGDCVGFVGPLGISVVISYVTILRKSGIIQQEYPTVSEFLNNGYVMGAIVFVAALVHGTFSQSSTHLVNVAGIHLKVALQALVYNKALRLCICNIDDHREDLTSSHEDEKPAKVTGLPGSKKMVEHKYHSVQSKDSFCTDMGTITNLMSEDVYNVMSFFWIGHYVWAIPLKIGVLMYLLYHKLGVSAIIGAAFCILTMTPLQFLIGKKMSANSKAITDVSDQRLRQMNEVLQGIRLLKLYGWECLYGDRILLTRAKELRLLDKDSFYWAVMIFLTHASSILVTVVTFGVYFLLEARPLTPENVFSGLALFNQLTVPLFIFPITVPIIISAMVSTNRLEKFLDLPETSSVMPASCNSDQQPETETEAVHQEVTALSPNYSERVVENNTLSYTEDGESIVKARAERADSVFGLGDILEQETENEETVDDTEREEEEVRNVRNPEANGEVAVAVEGGKFSWSVDTGKPMLILSNIVFPSGKLTVIVGRVGSGKSSLLSALLGEMPRLDGKVKWTIGSVIGYASQKPWLLNATMRENILFGQPFRPRRYGRIIEACSLQPDIDILPGKDLTEIGEKGINLSGGQKQRIAVARALYSQANVVILDDPLSALDYHVGQKLVDSGIRRVLLRQKRTVILVTHRLQLLAHAHQIIALEGGSVRAQGSLTEIEANDRELVRTWRAAMSREALEEKRNARSVAARDRWQLLKLVSRIGVQLKQRNIVDGTWKTDEEAHVTPPVFLPLRRRQGTFSGSRYFTHDLPLPMDECEAEFLEQTRRTSGGSGRLSLRHRSRAATTTETPGVMKQKSSLLRASSLQAGRTVVHGDTYGKRSLHSSTIVRQSSSPNVQNSQNAPDINYRSQVFTGPDNSGQPSSLLRRIFSIRTRRSSSVATLAMSDHSHMKRLPSTASGGSDDIDDDDPYSEVMDAQTGRLLSEEREYGKIPKRIYLQYLRACSVCVGTGYLASTFGWQGLRVYTDYWLNQWTNSGNTGNSTVPHMWDYEMKYYLLVYGALSVVSILLSLSSNGIGQYAGARARQVLHENMLRNVIRCPLRFFESTPVGRIINRFSTDMSVIDKKIATSIQRLLQFLLLCFSAIIVNAVVTPWFLIAAVPICIVYFAIQRFYRCSARELQRLDSITRSPILSHFSETLGGLITIRAFGHQMRFQSLLFSMVDAHTSAFLIMNTSNRWLGIALDYLGGVIVFMSVVAALLTARMYPDVTSSLVGLAVNYTLLVPIYLNWVVMFLADMEMYMGAVERVQQYAHIPTEDYCLQGITVPRSWPQNGDIVFEDVSLCYDTSRGPIISNLNLHIPAGQKVGICGRSGSGKSSLVMSLFHMVDIFEGKILIDGVDIKLVPLQVLRSRLSVIPQDVIMFSGTIRENLDPQSQYSDIELWKSLELAQLKDVVSNLPGCLDAEVREGGENLSAGERQLFCLARAILHNAACLVMDEATSSVDPSTEKALLAAATRAFAGKTVITIAHRLSTILDYDRILVLESGRIMEDGSPTQLRHRSMGIFSSMLRASQEETPFTKNEQGSQELIVNKFRGKRL